MATTYTPNENDTSFTFTLKTFNEARFGSISHFKRYVVYVKDD